MRLRLQLLLLALVTLILPWAGWQFARGLETRLREGQARSLADTAAALARVIAAERLALPPSGPVFFAAEGRTPIRLDGMLDEWTTSLPDAQRFTNGDSTLAVAAMRYGGALHLAADYRSASSAVPEAVRIALDDGSSVKVFRLTPAADGTAAVVAENGNADPVPVQAAMLSDTTGTRVELRFAANAMPQRLGIESIAGAVRIGTAPDRLHGLWPLIRAKPEWTRRLTPLAPDGLRLRIVHADGWVLAEAGDLAPLPPLPPAWQRLLSGLLSAGDDGLDRDSEGLRVASPELSAAFAGQTAGGWQRPDGGAEIRLLAAAPIGSGGGSSVALEVVRRSEAALLAQEALSGLMAVSLTAMLAVALVLLVYASWLSWRIRRLGRAVDAALERERDTPLRFAASSARDEIGELSRRFARLLEEVAGYTDYLRTLAGKLSHELNTPLAIVRSSLENLASARDRIEGHVYLRRAREGADRLLAIVRAMSEATRVERAIASADAEDFDLTALVSGCAEGYRPLLGSRRLDLQLPATPIPFHGASELLAQALDKLVDNARSFCPDSGWIAISLAGGAEHIEIAVANDGPPLPDITEERLFDSLVSVRARGQRSDGTPHLGLGLHIVRLIVELHRGVVRARNLPRGGVEFRLKLRGMPRKPPSIPGAH